MTENKPERKPILYSGIQPTGDLNLGTYIGAVHNWLKIQDDYLSIYGIADLHALTVRRNPQEFRKTAWSLFAQYIACGLDPEKSILYFQSHVHQHAELSWILGCYTYIGELQRMTQYKDKSAQHSDNLNIGLLDYPVLMAADILLYQANVVPVGVDQKQHLELTRDIAIRFNNAYGDTFVVPEGNFGSLGDKKICSLQDPTKKMSKSDPNPDSIISIVETPDQIMKKIRRAVTDSEAVVEYREDKPGVSNLLEIFSAMSGRDIDDLVKEHHTAGYKTFKEAVGESIVEKMRPIREEYERLMQDKNHLIDLASQGAERAAYLAEKTLAKVKRKIGLTDLKKK
jgi:tryptophanyl-tRNA synthetase